MKSIDADLNPLPFEKVSLVEAKSVLDGDDVATSTEIKRWEDSRRRENQKNHDLHELTYRWFAKLPENIKTWDLIRYFPRIANELADVWERPTVCARFLDQLLLDNRGDRKGFPVKVMREIMTLQHYFNHVAAPRSSNPQNVP